MMERAGMVATVAESFDAGALILGAWEKAIPVPDDDSPAGA